MMMMMIQHLLVAILALLLHPGCSFAPHRVVIAITKGAIEILLAFSLLAFFSPSNNKSETISSSPRWGMGGVSNILPI
jgi:hypothetical protein